MQTINLYNKFIDKFIDEWSEEWSEEWFQFIKDNPDKKWNYGYLSENPNITWEIVQAELIANVWHPRNFEKFKYLDPETFGEEF
jgi:hypothetical protein